MMDYTRALYKQTEFQFALNFDDPKQMSSMVGLTAGAECKEVGITTQQVRREMAGPHKRAAAVNKSVTRLNVFNQVKRDSMRHASPAKFSSTMKKPSQSGSNQKSPARPVVFHSMASTKFSSTKHRPYSSAIRLQR